MIPLLVLQALIGLGPFTAVWDTYAVPSATLRLYVDDVLTTTVPATATSVPFTVPAVGAHTLGLSAVIDGKEGPKTLVSFTSSQTDSCLPPLGTHAPAIFLTSITPTTGRPGSRSLLNFQLGGPDTVTLTAVQIDGLDQPPMAGTDLRAFGSMWFTHPSPGTHAIGLRIQTSFGCSLTRGGLTLVVK